MVDVGALSPHKRAQFVDGLVDNRSVDARLRGGRRRGAAATPHDLAPPPPAADVAT